MSLASISGYTVSRARVQVPAWGIPWVDLDLAEDAELSGSQTLTFADVEIVCTVVSGGAANGRAGYRLVCGAGGWGQEVATKAYANDAGVKIATVAGDVAAAVGETLANVPTTRLGPHYARSDGLASRVMHDVAPQAWYVGLDGVTYFGARAATTYDGTAARIRVDPAGSVIELATEEIAALLPGVQVDGSLPATDVEYSLDSGRLTARIYSGARTSRRVDALSRLLDALDPWRKYRGHYEYRVVTQTSERLNLQIVRAASGMPDLERVPVRPGMAGERATVTLGELVLVTFVDGDPSRPVVTNHDAPDAPGWSPTMLELGDTGGQLVALSNLIDGHLNDLHEMFTVTWVPPVAPAIDNGLALKAAWIAKYDTHPAGGFSSTAASKVKAK